MTWILCLITAIPLGVLLVYKLIYENALKKLDASQKASFIDAFSNYRIYSISAVVVLIGLTTGVSILFPSAGPAVTLFVFCLSIPFIVGSQIFIFQKLKTLRLPKSFVNQYLLASSFLYVGCAIACVCIVSQLVVSIIFSY